MSWVSTAKLGACFFTWFFLNVMYNITNKKCQNAFPMPWTMTFVSLAVGARRTRGRRHAHARAQSHLFYSVGLRTGRGRAHGRSTSRPARCARRRFFARPFCHARPRTPFNYRGAPSPVSLPPLPPPHLSPTLWCAPPPLFPGVPYILLLWASGLRKAPKFNPGWWKVLLPIGAAHALGHAGAVIALGAGAVSFAQTVKAAEPVFTCVLSYIVLGTVFKWQVYATLLPIIGGVSLASLKELSFTWKALYGALLSNVAFASRAVLSKATMQKPVGENMTAPNLYGVLTILAFLMSLPFGLYYEGAGFGAAWKAATGVGGTCSAFWLTRQMILDGFYYYAYNEVAFITLDRVSPITHSIANTIKRVCIILATVLVFGNKLTTLGAIGSATAVAGTLMYSLAKAKFK